MSAQRIELVGPTAQTANGNSAWFSVPTATMAMVGLDITVDDFTDITVWLQGSDDGGTTAYDLLADQTLPSTGVEAPGTETTNKRDICDAGTGVGKYSAVYKHLATDTVRLMWDLNGTSATFSASMVVK